MAALQDSNLNGQAEEIPYAAFNGALYLREKVEADFSQGIDYQINDRVYKDGFVYEAPLIFLQMIGNPPFHPLTN